jgi:Right handed beta helix region
MTKALLLGVAALASISLDLSTAYAQIARAWVSGKGADAAGCGAPTAPCRSFQYVHDNIIAAGGEIDVLDPSGYGAIVINKAISIVNDGVGTAGVQAASGNAITINAQYGDAIFLRGLTIEGLGTGTNGVVFNTGSSLTIKDSAIRRFANDGVLAQPTSGGLSSVLIANTIVSENSFAGIEIKATPSGTANIRAVIDHVIADNNTHGVDANSFSTASGSTYVAVSNTVSSNNSQDGMYFGSNNASLFVTVDSCEVNNNGFSGIYGDTAAIVRLRRSVVTLNDLGVRNTTSPNTFYSYGDNSINGNVTDITSPMSTVEKLQ